MSAGRTGCRCFQGSPWREPGGEIVARLAEAVRFAVMLAALLALGAGAARAEGGFHACAYREQYTLAQLQELAAWDWLVTGTERADYLAYLRGRTRVLHYFDGVFAGTWLTNWDEVNGRESWFTHDVALGYRLFSADFNNYLMDPRTPWAAWIVTREAAKGRQLGCQGLFMDDCLFTTRYLRLHLRSEAEPAAATDGKVLTRVRTEAVLGIYDNPGRRGRNWKEGAAVIPGPEDHSTIMLPPGAPRRVYLDYLVSDRRDCEPAVVEVGPLVRTRWPIQWVYGVWTEPEGKGESLYAGHGQDQFSNRDGRGTIRLAGGASGKPPAVGSTVYVQYKASFLPPGLEEGWQDALAGMLRLARERWSGGLLYYNGVDRRGGDSRYAAIADGGMLEEAFHARGVRPNWCDGPDRWALFLQRIVSYQKGNKRVLLQSGSAHGSPSDEEKTVTFCYASYLLGSGERSSFNFAWDYDGLYRPAQWRLDLGAPLGDYRRHEDGIYSRRFARALVVVRPPLAEGYRRGATVSHALGGQYRKVRLDGTLEPPTDTVALEDATGAILLPLERPDARPAGL